jgi:hypothetical protein
MSLGKTLAFRGWTAGATSRARAFNGWTVTGGATHVLDLLLEGATDIDLGIWLDASLTIEVVGQTDISVEISVLGERNIYAKRVRANSRDLAASASSIDQRVVSAVADRDAAIEAFRKAGQSLGWSVDELEVMAEKIDSNEIEGGE